MWNYLYFIFYIWEQDKDDDDVYHHTVQLFDKTTQKVFFDKSFIIYDTGCATVSSNGEQGFRFLNSLQLFNVTFCL
mgnify:CR=1 FL=1